MAGRLLLSPTPTQLVGLLLLIFLLAVSPIRAQDEDIPHNEVKNWALKFGVNLWAYGKQMTKMNEIQKGFKHKEVRVQKKDGLFLIRDLAEELHKMMDSKMQSVLRIMDSAEQAALSHKSDAAMGRYSGRRAHRHTLTATPSSDLKSSDHDRDPVIMSAAFGSDGGSPVPSRHFDHLPVNTNQSAVLLAAGVSAKEADVVDGIQWSELLDPLFVDNYEMDPTLSWQYFGSSSGFLRRYPDTSSRGPIHDFRASQWFVSAATSPKDIVILLDTSSSVTKDKRDLAIATATAILDTLGDNDFANVFRIGDNVREVTPCFRETLAQANAANVRELKAAMRATKPEGTANITAALITGFEILRRFNRTHQGSQCNQAMMLITGGPLQASYENSINMYNRPHMPVRLFTYLVGKDSNTAAALNWIACENKGYFTRISSNDHVRRKVLNYVFVMARPLVMYQNEHPVQWTPVYRGGKGNSLLPNERKDGQLMTSVSAPVFDRRNYSERVANLLGVVGTDVPIDQIMKLIQPYRLGVNGYAFIVDNNGHVLYHPDLRPLFQDTLKPEYNSVDLAEVELVDSDSSSRENNSILLDLRHDMVEQKEGEIEMTVKTHYNDMKRVTTRRNKYFYYPIVDTPFSLGLALPEGYGMFEAIGDEEIKRSNVNLSDIFKGNQWRIHPDWVYCEYNYATDHHYDSPEQQFLDFLHRVRRPGWKWMSQRHWTSQPSEGPQQNKKLERDSYYCDKTLVQSLVYDASITATLEKWSKIPGDKDNEIGYQMFGPTLTFVATRSGLLRWQNIGENGSIVDKNTWDKDDPEPHFSEGNLRSIDEVWYKRAVEQHRIEPESFVYSVPFDGGLRGKPLVTATHAFFVENKGHRAPAGVVGIQYRQATLATHFLNITSSCTSKKCTKTCASDELDCYILDNNGFIILSESPDEAGRFFGQVDGTIMDSLVQDRIYKKVAVMDYQGACSDSDSHYSSAPARPIYPIGAAVHWSMNWVVNRIGWLAAQMQLSSMISSSWSAAEIMLKDLRDYASFADADDFDGDEDGETDDEDVTEDEEGGEDDEEDSEDTASDAEGESDDLSPYGDMSAGAGGGGVGATDQRTFAFPSNDWNRLKLPSVHDNIDPMRGPTRNDIISGFREESATNEDLPQPMDEEDRLPMPAPLPPPTASRPPPPPPPPSPSPSPTSYGPLNNSRARPCDKRIDLYMLQPDRLNTSGMANPLKGKLTNCHSTGCERPFSVQKIPFSNLILLVVDTLCPCGSKQLAISASEVIPEGGGDAGGAACRGRPARPTLYRRRPHKCINYHPEESVIRACSSSPRLRPTELMLPAIFLFLLIFLSFHRLSS